MIRKLETSKGIKWGFVIELGNINGKRKRIQKGGFNTKKEALLAKAKALEELENGGIIEQSNISLSDFLDYWFNEYVLLNCKHHTQISYKNIINKLKDEFGNYKLKNITSATIQKFINEKFKNNIAFNSIRLYRTVFKSALNYAVHPCNYIKENPIKNIKIPKKIVTEEKEQTITIEQFNEIISLIPNQPRFKLAIIIAFHTGMRASEICGLTWDNIDLKKKEINVKYNIIYHQKSYTLSSVKSKSSNRIINIGDTLKNILQEEKERQKALKENYKEFYYKDTNNNDFVCSHDNGQPVAPTTLVVLCNRDLKKRGLKFDFNFHMLRHTHATLLIESGANIVDVSNRLGHSNISITLNVYSHITQKMKDDTVNIFEKIIK